MRPPIMTEASEKEKRIAQLQIGFASRLRKSEYYIVESTKSTGMLVSNVQLVPYTNNNT